MSTAPVPGFITKTEATESYERSHRQLTRDIADAMKSQNAKVLDHCQLRTEDGQVLEGSSVTPDIIDQLRLEGKNPVWYLRTTWLEEAFGRRGRARRPSERPTLYDLDSPSEEGSVLSPRPDLVHVLRETIRSLERDKDDLRAEMKIKNQQIADRVEREKETNALIRDLHNLMADLQQRVLPPIVPRISEPKDAPYRPADPTKTASPNSEPRSRVTEIEIDRRPVQPKPEKETALALKSKSAKTPRSAPQGTIMKARTVTKFKTPTPKPPKAPRKSKRFWSRLFS